MLADSEYVSYVLKRMARPRVRLATSRDPRYLFWRYGQLDEYRALRASPAARRAGIAIFRLRPYGPYWIADVCELLLERGTRSLGRGLLRDVRDAAATDVLRCNFQSRREAAAFGFVEATRGARLITYPLQKPPPLDFTASGTWALSRGDLELL